MLMNDDKKLYGRATTTLLSLLILYVPNVIAWCHMQVLTIAIPFSTCQTYFLMCDVGNMLLCASEML